LARLRAATHDLHAVAERGGIYGALIAGRASRTGYLLLLRNLEPVYAALEQGLETDAVLAPFDAGLLRRGPAITRDLDHLSGPRWRQDLPLLAPAADYANHLANLAETDPPLLLAHVYTRYLGDLSGGRLLRRLVQERLGVPPEALAYFDFPEHVPSAGPCEEPTTLGGALRTAIAHAAQSRVHDGIVEEACAAFSLTIALSEAVAEYVGNSAPR
jgi:heme oxygenase